jgi:cell wall-associated NlpC family hydrolase
MNNEPPKDTPVQLVFDHLLGRPYVDGENHCYKLARDFFRDNFDLELGDYVIPTNWDARKLDLIGKIHEKEGFEKVPDWSIKSLRPGDVLCIAVRSNNANHLAIYVGNNEIIHHPLAQLSRVESIGDFYLMSTMYVLRHPAVPDLRPTGTTVTIQELLDARYRPQAAA